MMVENRIKALVVDDEKTVRDFFKRLLSLMNLETMEAEDGRKAIEMARKGKFDLFFLDVCMPGLNGLETYREIHKLDPQANVIMMTGYAVEDILEQARKEGVRSAIRKPFDINQIKEIINKVDIERNK